jgi:hypothetical protein
MNCRAARVTAAALAIAATWSGRAAAQERDEAAGRTFSAGAATLRAVHFTSPGETELFMGGYGYAAVGRMLLGGEGGGVVGAGDGAKTTWGVATLGYAAWEGSTWHVYPMAGFGGGSIRGDGGAMYLLGAGLDVIPSRDGRGMLLGARAGYVSRWGGPGVTHVGLSFGGGG